MKHRKPNRAQRAVASTSLPLAAAAAVATLLAAPAGAVPNDPSTPSSPAPAPAQPGTDTPSQNAPGGTSPTPGQPGVTTPDPNQVMPDPKKDPKLGTPAQPGVSPRVAPLPVPGQSAPAQPAGTPDQPGAQATPSQPGVTQPSTPGTPTPGAPGQGTPGEGGTEQGVVTPGTPAVPGTESEGTPAQPGAGTDTLVQQPTQPRWEAPRLESAPAAPVVEMNGPRTEIGANIDGGTLLPGYVANTHHFSNQAGYVGTVGYNTPGGAGEAGISVEFTDPNTVTVHTFTGGAGLADNKNTVVVDTTQVNQAKAAVEQWIAQQPGGAAALEAAAQVRLPAIVPQGDVVPQTVDVAGITTQWGGSVRY